MDSTYRRRSHFDAEPPVYSRDRLPTYEEVMNEQSPRRRSFSAIGYAETASDISSTFQRLLICPPHNQAFFENGWTSEYHMDGCLAKNEAYFRAVLNHLRANWNATLTQEMSDMVDEARRLTRALERAVRQYFEVTLERCLAQAEAAYRNALLHNPTVYQKARAWAVYKRDRVIVTRNTKRACTSRVNNLDDFMYKIHLQKQAIFFRSLGLQQF